LKILIVYFQEDNKNIRNTISEHLYSFARYSGEDCYYLNVATGVPAYIDQIAFDIVIYHYTLCACRFFRSKFEKQLVKWSKLKAIAGYKVAVLHDEYLNTDLLCRFFLEYSVKTVFTCLPQTEWRKVYPKELSGVEDFVTVLTGYIDEASLERVSKFVDDKREIDIGYRARKVPYYLGRHGCLKWQIAEKFIDACRGSKLKIDIATDTAQNVYFGEDWYKFLSRCRTVLGCEGGASMIDPDGQIKALVDDYLRRRPDASFDEVEQACFPGMDGNLELFAISPRHFECCITKTCQVLVEGEYGGILKPGIHYIEVKKDWSNIKQAIAQISDHDLCKKIADNAYRDIIESGEYTYRKFVNIVIEKSGKKVRAKTSENAAQNKALKKLVSREKNSNIYLMPRRFKFLIHDLLRALGVFDKYLQIREYGLQKFFAGLQQDRNKNSHAA